MVAGGRRGKDDRKQNTLAPLVATIDPEGKAGHKDVNSLTVTVNSLITATFWKVRVTK